MNNIHVLSEVLSHTQMTRIHDMFQKEEGGGGWCCDSCQKRESFEIIARFLCQPKPNIAD